MIAIQNLHHITSSTAPLARLAEGIGIRNLGQLLLFSSFSNLNSFPFSFPHEVKCQRNGIESNALVVLEKMGTGSGSDSNSGSRTRGLILKAVVLIGGALLLRNLTKSTTRWDHARIVAETLSGEKFSRDQAARDPDNYFNLRMLTCPATVMVDGSRVLYFEQAFWRTPEKPFRQRFYMVKPCPKEMKCVVEVSSFAIKDAEEYKNFCDRPKDQRPKPDEVLGDIADHLTTIHLSRCERGKRCLYEGSTPPGGYPNSWNGAANCTSELTILKNNEIHTWDRGYDEEGNQVWGAKEGPYEFKPAPGSKHDDMFSPWSSLSLLLDKKKEESFVTQE